jgi:RHS repeat-associated protein
VELGRGNEKGANTFTYTVSSVTATATDADMTAQRTADDPLDDAISRVYSLQDHAGASGQVNLEVYSYLGIGTIVKRAHPENGVDLTYIDPGDTLAGHDGGDQYTGLDRFGRVAEQLWIKSGTAKDRFQYGYDADGNVLYKKNTVSTANSELYHANSTTSGDNSGAYDGLNRLLSFARGTLSSSGNNGTSLDSVTTDATTPILSSWNLDTLGNSSTTTALTSSSSQTSADASTTVGTSSSQNTWVGGKFTVGSSDITVAKLGRWKISGNSGTHTVKLVLASNGTDVTGGSVSIDLSSGTNGAYKYVSLARPIVLTASTSYYLVSQEANPGDAVYSNDTTVTNNSGITTDKAVSWNGSAWSESSTSGHLYGPVDLKFVKATKTRSHNLQNELTDFDTGSGSNEPTFDNNGNTTKDETLKQYVYDAWNRMVTAKSSGGSTLRSFTYDAIGRQVTRSGFDPEVYYSKNYQDIEDRDNAYSPATIAQNVWSMAYVDAMVLRDRDADLLGNTGTYGLAGSGLEERLYVQQDANFNVTAIVNTSGTVVERYKYDPYGSVSFMDASFGVRSSSSFSWVTLHQGLYYETADGLYYDRTRYYSPTLMRFMQTDPMGYVDGVSLYQYERSRPIARIDPVGTDSEPPGDLEFSLGIVLDKTIKDNRWVGNPKEGKVPHLNTQWVINPLMPFVGDVANILPKAWKFWVVQHVTAYIYIYFCDGKEDFKDEMSITRGRPGHKIDYYESWLYVITGFRNEFKKTVQYRPE